MPRQEGLRPIGESVKKIIEKIKKEREERQKKSSSPRTQPKLPGMKNGGGADARNPSIREYANILKDKDKVTEADMERARKRLSTETGRKVARFHMNKEKQRIETKKADDKADDKVKASLREISARGMMKGGEMKKGRREKPKQGIPPKPTTKPTRPKPMMPPIKKKKDSGYDKTKNQPRQDARVE